VSNSCDDGPAYTYFLTVSGPKLSRPPNLTLPFLNHVA
jgi:hypothetical protein